MLRKLRRLLRRWRKWPRPGRCGGCHRFCILHHQETMTAYCDEASNWSGFGCKECNQQYVDYWSERWDDLYRDRDAGIARAMNEIRAYYDP